MSRSLSNRRRAQCVSRNGPLRHPSTHERVPPKIASPTTDEHLPRCFRNKVALGIFPPNSPYWTQARQKLPNCDIEIKGYAELIGAFARYTRCKELAANVRSIYFYDEDPNEIGDNTFSFLLAPHTNGLPGWLPNLERVVIRAPSTRVPMDDVLPQAKWVDVLRVAWTYAGEQGGTLQGGSPKSSKANRPHRRLSRVEITPDIFRPCFSKCLAAKMPPLKDVYSVHRPFQPVRRRRGTRTSTRRTTTSPVYAPRVRAYTITRRRPC